MKKIQEFNKDIIFNYKPSQETMELGLLVMEKLGKLNVRIQDAFKDHMRPARIFAFIESKYSSKIEGIYTTLFDVVNTGIETNQQKLIRPLVEELFKSKEVITIDKLRNLEDIMNSSISKEKRWDPKFGIYQTKNDIKEKIYQPPMEEKVVSKLLSEVVDKASKDNNIIKMLHTHIMFEKVHPFADANGRLGRLILQRSLARLMNYSSVLPLSHAIFSLQGDYYSAFDIYKEGDLDKSIQTLLNIILKMYKTTKAFLMELSEWSKQSVGIVKKQSNKVTDEMAWDIILALQTKVKWIVRHHKINRKTVDSIFEKVSEELDFNRKVVSKNVAYWNIGLEGIIDKYYR